jgi:antitoxin component of RelBE/YafQ-DinJ toxin-antitoxin module
METATCNTYNINIAPEVETEVRERGLPFEVREKIPNAETQAAIDECEAMIRGEIPWPPAQTVEEIFAEFEEELRNEHV